ncbi:MAG: hypothetical protein CSA66_06490 [Proteobacteria bacterium]|nr:MAG: hypothetical protein CSA66_06490 [Pseudomonadota bacterium]
MIRRPVTLTALAAAFTFALAACDSAGGAGGAAFPGEGDVYPAATVEDCDGAPVSLTEWIGRHDVVFITFGAKWCSACQEEAPRLNEELVDGLADQRVGVAQILIEDDPGVPPETALCGAWRDGLNARYTVLVDTAQASLPQHFGDAVATLPLHFIVTRDGTIRLRKLGELPTNIAQLVQDWIP